jgi:hypothetical protein
MLIGESSFIDLARNLARHAATRLIDSRALTTVISPPLARPHPGEVAQIIPVGLWRKSGKTVMENGIAEAKFQTANAAQGRFAR